MSEIIVIGSLNADLVVRTVRAPQAGETVTGSTFHKYNGGKGANQAIAVGRLGGKVAMLGRVGADSYGDDLIRSLIRDGVGIESVRKLDEHSTGIALIVVEETGENRIVVVPGANGAYSPKQLQQDAAAFKDAQFALFQLETPLETVQAALSLARQSGCCTILDPAPAQPLPVSLLAMVDYLTPNSAELETLLGKPLPADESFDRLASAAGELLRNGVGKVVLKLGSRGSMLVQPGGFEHVPAFPVNPVDTTAAGDCFNAAFALSLQRGMMEKEAMRYANAAAALSVTRPGAQQALPAHDEVLQLLG